MCMCVYVCVCMLLNHNVGLTFGAKQSFGLQLQPPKAKCVYYGKIL